MMVKFHARSITLFELVFRRATAAVVVTLVLSVPAQAFDIGFDWSGLKSCRSGSPGTVNSPAFSLREVPAGTKFIRFKLVDLNYPAFDHGGGTVAFASGAEIPAGAFKYKQPCPPNGSHTYEWTATAQSKKSGGKLGTAKARRDYPE
jgi:phosphatidylethanolamine-binding protein (PEBP) family uncharacterized protein